MIDSRILDLVVQFEEARHQGAPRTPEDVCRDCPELLDALRAALARLGLVDKQLGPSAVDAAASGTALPQVPGFELSKPLGHGGMGVVYLARNTLMDRLEVLKLIKPGFLEHPDAVSRFLREIQAAARLSHPNIVTAYAALEVGELLVLAMEYVEGEDLARIVKTIGPLPVGNACAYAYQASMGLQHAFEQGLVHRDIKPHNLILAHDGKKHVVKILDFGLAKATREKAARKLTAVGSMVGTPDYIAPEQIVDSAGADIRADIYSLGCTLYFLLSGHPPFTGKSGNELLEAHQTLTPPPLTEVRPEVPARLAAVVARMMAKEPAARYAKPIEAAQALALFVQAGLKPLPAAPASTAGTPLTLPSPAGGEGRVRGAPMPGVTVLDAHGPGRPETTVSEPVVRPTKVEGDATMALGAVETPVSSSVAAKRQRRRVGMGLCAAGGLLLAVAVALWAGGVFGVSGGEGILLVSHSPNLEVHVDGKKMPVTWTADAGPAEVRLSCGIHLVELKRDGTTLASARLAFTAGEPQGPLAVPVDAAAPFTLRVKPLQITLARGGKAKLTFFVERHGYDGPIALELSDPPTGVTAANAILPAGTNELAMEWIADQTAALGVKKIAVVATAVARDRRPVQAPPIVLSVLRSVAALATAELPELVDALADADPIVRETATFHLSRMGAPAIPDLVRLLADSPRQPVRARVAAAEALANMGAQPFIVERMPAVLKLLADPAESTDVRLWLSRLMAYFRDESALQITVPVLEKVCTEPAAQETAAIRYNCASVAAAARRAQSPEVVLNVLAEWLKGPARPLYRRDGGKTVAESGDSRVMAVDALRRIGPDKLKDRDDIVQQLRRLADDPDAAPPLRDNAERLVAELSVPVPPPVGKGPGAVESLKLVDGEGRVERLLDAADATLPDGTRYKEYTFKAEAGRTYRVVLVSKSFDAHLILKDDSGKVLKASTAGGIGSEARLTVHSAKGSTYHIVAAQFYGKLGPFTLAVREVDPAPAAPALAEDGLIREMKFVRVRKGSFFMGWDSERKKSQQVFMDYDFQIAAFCVTQEQWEKVIGANPSYFSRDGAGKDRVAKIPDAVLRRFPVELVSWDDAQDFIKKLNRQQAGKGWTYRLPREAEWEYACRGAVSSLVECSCDFYVGKQGTNDLSSKSANFDGNSPAGNAEVGKYLKRPEMVGQYPPTRLGLYDMHGNVWQWCEEQVIRGGSWFNIGQNCAAGIRRSREATERAGNLGFRLVRVSAAGKD
jgi:formylglycine-generating enzyme required for sulfatase activity